MLVGLPLTSGPVAFFLALDRGTGFAARATIGSLQGIAAEAAFCVAYGWAARAGWEAGLLAGSLGFALAGSILQVATLPRWLLLAIVLGALLGALRLMPRFSGTGAVVVPPRWDLPGRMIVATVLILSLTAAASWLGPQMSGLLATYPIFATVLAVFAHRTEGRAAALDVLRGLLLGLFSFAGFFVVLGLAIERLGISLSFAAAIAAAIAVQAVSLALIRKAVRIGWR